MEQSGQIEGRSLWASMKPYLEKESLAAFFLGVSSGFPFALLAATLTTRLAQDGIEKSTVTAFTLAFLVSLYFYGVGFNTAFLLVSVFIVMAVWVGGGGVANEDIVIVQKGCY